MSSRSDQTQVAEPRPKRRYLVDIRGVLHVDASSGSEADRLAEAWIAAIKGDERPRAGDPESPGAVTVGYLRVFPDDEIAG